MKNTDKCCVSEVVKHDVGNANWYNLEISFEVSYKTSCAFSVQPSNLVHICSGEIKQASNKDLYAFVSSSLISNRQN